MKAKTIAALLLTILAAPALAQQTPPRDPVRRRLAPTGTASIEGTVVVNDGPAKGLRRARVTASSATLTGGRTTITRDDGSYRIEGLPPGRYTVRAAKEAYVTMAYGARLAAGAGTSIVLGAGDRRRGIDITLPRGAVLSGMIADAAGQPVPGATVSALANRFVPERGEHRLVNSGISGVTDDRGEYRLFGLPAGEYAVAARINEAPQEELQVLSEGEIRRALSEVTQASSPFRSRPGIPLPPPPPARSATEPRRSVTYAPTYFPGTTRGGQALLVAVGTAEERGGLDFTIEHVPIAAVSGHVLMPDAAEWPIEVRLVPARSRLLTEQPRIARTRSGDTFLFRGVPPGQYTLIARPYAAASRLTPPTWGMLDIVVDGDDVTGLLLAGQPGVSAAGRLVFEGATAPPRLLSRPLPLPLVHAVAGLQGTAIVIPADDARFTIEGPPGAYQIHPAAPGIRQPLGRWFVKSVKANGIELLDRPFELGPGIGDVAVTLTDRATEVTGWIVVPNGERAADSFVVLFSPDRQAWFAGSRRIAGVRTRDDGSYTIRNLPAGDYLTVAVADIEEGDWWDPAVLERLSPGAVRVTLREAERKIHDLRLRWPPVP